MRFSRNAKRILQKPLAIIIKRGSRAEGKDRARRRNKNQLIKLEKKNDFQAGVRQSGGIFSVERDKKIIF